MPVRVDEAGILRFEVSWQGRSLVNLKLEDADGTQIARKTGPSPLEIRVSVPERPAAALEWSLRFAPTITRGELEGEVRVSMLPLDTSGLSTAELARRSQRETAPEPSALRFEGPGACLQQAAGDDAAGLALASLSSALSGAGPEGRAWTQRWAGRLHDLKRQEDVSGSLDRTRIDRLWEQMKMDPPVDEHCASAVRRLLAAMERLSRSEASSDAIESLRAIKRRREVLGALACLEDRR